MKNNGEIWKPIAGYEDLYEVSNLGRVRSKSHMFFSDYFRNGRYHRSVVLAPSLNPANGYCSVVLSGNYKKKTSYVHRLVAETFIDNPYHLEEVNHKNEDKTDNRAENLEWCDRVYNRNYGTGDIRRQETARKNKRGKCYPHIVHQYSLNGEYITSYDSTEIAARALGLSSGSNIRACARSKGNGSYKQAHGYIWRYDD